MTWATRGVRPATGDGFPGVRASTWRQVPSGKTAGAGKEIPIGNLCREAQERLQELGLDDREVIVELRLTGTQRLWALREGSMLYVLWWDLHHKVCPSTKRNT